MSLEKFQKLGGEPIIPYRAHLLEITMNGTLPGNWKKATVIPIHKGGDRSLVTNYGPVGLTSVVCKKNGTRYSFLSKACVG